MADALHIAAALGWKAWYTLGVIVVMVVTLVREVARPALILLGALGALLVAGVVTPEQGFVGFSNPAVLTIGALYVVAAGIQRSGALSFFGRLLGTRRDGLPGVLLRVMVPTALLSGFINNTPVVAMLIPRLQEWAERHNVSVSKLLMPLSYAAIVGGMSTLIGTSTNLVVSGLMQTEGYTGLGLFDLSLVGVPVAVCVLVYFVLIGHRLLPDHSTAQETFEKGLQKYLFEVKVAFNAPFIGQTVDEAGLRALGDAYLVHIRRGGRTIPATPDEMLHAGDVLTFVGGASRLGALLQRPGFGRTVSAVGANENHTLPLYEAVVASSANLVGKTLREVDFREQYQGVVLGIQRKDEQIEGALGRIPIKPGDLLLIEAQHGFDKRWNADRDEFYLAAPRRPGQARPKPHKVPIALTLLVAMVGVVAIELLPISVAAFLAALGMILTGCLQAQEAREAVNLPVLVVIAAAFGLGKAVEVTGLAGAAAQGLLSVADGGGALAAIIALYVGTNVLTELVTNQAAAVLMTPVALAAASDVGVPPEALAITVAIAASASFVTPIGYHTNLMVMSPGGYRVRDYTRAGLPVSLLVMVVAVAMIYGMWG